MEKYIAIIKEDIKRFIKNYLRTGELADMKGMSDLDENIPSKYPYLSILYLLKQNGLDKDVTWFIDRYKLQLLEETGELKKSLGHFLWNKEDVDELTSQLSKMKSLVCSLSKEKKDLTSQKEKLVHSLEEENMKLKQEIDRLTTKIEDIEDLQNSIISIYYYNSDIDKIVACNKGYMFYIGADEDFLFFEDGRVQINPGKFKSLENKAHICYDSLLTHINDLYLSDEIIRSGRFIIAYDGRYDYCDVVRYVIRIFGFLPKDARLVKKNHLEAFYCGANSMKYNMGNTNFYMSVESHAQTCIINAGEGVVDFFENVPKEEISHSIKLNSKFDQELLAGALLLFKIWRKEELDFCMLDTFPYDIQIGIFEDKQEFIVHKGSNIPYMLEIEIEKGYAEKLYIKIGSNLYRYPIDNCFQNDICIKVKVEIDANGVPTINVSSDQHSKCSKIAFSDLLMNN